MLCKKTTLDYWTKVLSRFLEFESTKMAKFKLMYTSTRLLAKKSSLVQINRPPNAISDEIWEISAIKSVYRPR
jgi:hypothetical protein